MPGPFKFGRNSRRELDTVVRPLQDILERAIRLYDFSVVQGQRTIETQIQNIRRGVSRTIDSRHIPRDVQGLYDPLGRAEAVDIVPYQSGINPWPQSTDAAAVREKKLRRFYFMQGVLYAVAEQAGVEVRFGLDWDSDLDFFDQSFDDLGHVELRTSRSGLVLTGELKAEANEALRSRGLRELD